MVKVLLTWLGGTDLRCAAGTSPGLGPLASGVTEYGFDKIVILNNYPPKESTHYVPWLKTHTNATIQLKKAKNLPNPVDYGQIYINAIAAIDDIKDQHSSDNYDLTLHLSPGTPQMQAIWILIAKTHAPKATLIQSSTEQGVSKVEVPFDITADFIGEFFREPDDRLTRLAQGLPPEAPQFSKIIHKSHAMKRVIAQARRLAPRNLPILIEGETGVGKELFAEAIHRSSPRASENFVAVNCGAIPRELVGSELFGHEKGAFSGAHQRRKGHFEVLDKGTIFLDEIGEMPFEQQVQLLRVLQENQVTRIGSTKPIDVDVRVIAATNKSLAEEVLAKRFRSDLFYRLAVGVLKIPPLRARKGDLPLLIEHYLEDINQTQLESDPGYVAKSLSAGAFNLLKRQEWKGNVRELINTLTRASIWPNGSTITTEDVKDSLFQMPIGDVNGEGILNRSIDDGVDLQEIMSNVAKHYLERAINYAPRNKRRAADILGFKNYQTFNNWLHKYDVEG